MKSLASLLAIGSLVGCTHIDAQKGTFFTMGDSTKFKGDWKDGKMTHVEWDSNLHTPMAKSIGHTAIMLGAEAATFGAGPGVGAAGGVITSIINRPTSRATPVPAK